MTIPGSPARKSKKFKVAGKDKRLGNIQRVRGGRGKWKRFFSRRRNRIRGRRQEKMYGSGLLANTGLVCKIDLPSENLSNVDNGKFSRHFISKFL